MRYIKEKYAGTCAAKQKQASASAQRRIDFWDRDGWAPAAIGSLNLWDHYVDRPGGVTGSLEKHRNRILADAGGFKIYTKNQRLPDRRAVRRVLIFRLKVICVGDVFD